MSQPLAGHGGPHLESHLKNDEIVDLVDGGGRLGRERAAHVRRCKLCRDQVQELQTVMDEVTDVPVPEPSPLFWDHLSQRVSEAMVDDGGVSWGRFREWHWSLSHLATAAATAAVVFGVVVGWRSADPWSDRSTGSQVVSEVGAEGPPTDEAQTDAAETPADWALLLAMAETVEWGEDVADVLMVQRRVISDMFSELTADERQLVAALIAAELEGGEL